MVTGLKNISPNADFELKVLPLELLEEDPNQPRSSLNTDMDKDRLARSLKNMGIKQPIIVLNLGNSKYKIIDGHRRYRVAKELGFESIPCMVYKNLPTGELEHLRFEVQNNRRSWKPLEKSVAFARIKEAFNKKTNKELAELLNVSETVISTSLNLNKQKEGFRGLMEEYELSISYQTEFIKLQPKLRAIRDFEIPSVVLTILKRIKNGVIRSAKDLRTLGKIFLRASSNENYLYEFLHDPDMTVKALEMDTIQSGFALDVEKITNKLHENMEGGINFSPKEHRLLRELHDLLGKALDKSK